jgi:hypothetical protein
MAVSLAGLDLSFLKKADPSACQPGRYRVHNNQLLPAHLVARLQRPSESKRSEVACPYFMPDVDSVYGGAWKSIIDGKEISSRSNWREHDKRNGVVNVGCDFWAADGDDIAYNEKKMGYDPSLIGGSDDCQISWKTPENVS